MKKAILGLSMIIIFALAFGVYYVFTNLDAIVKAAIEKHGSAATHTAVRVDKVRIELTNGVGTIKGLTVANPTGFNSTLAFSLGEIHTQIDLSSLKEEPYIIDEIRIVAPQIVFEINNDNKTNLDELKKNLSAGPEKSKVTSGAKPGNVDEPRLIIKRILFSEGRINALVVPLNNKEYQLKLPTINMTNLGGHKGATPTELTNEIINRLINQAKKAIKNSSYGKELERLKGEANARIEAEKTKAKAKVESEKAKLKEESDAKLEAEKQKVEDKLKGLFNK
ncbi:hypothetical protein MNBD_GAMMA21-1604 [hydrothermal vent metagenome]|uniref:AsmA domain-containing protein n=1 Tax=hydrothermal vent metagenome TaxID=652676 RepID=A0A3B1AMB3_9ZZZZ